MSVITNKFLFVAGLLFFNLACIPHDRHSSSKDIWSVESLFSDHVAEWNLLSKGFNQAEKRYSAVWKFESYFVEEISRGTISIIYPHNKDHDFYTMGDKYRSGLLMNAFAAHSDTSSQ